jgi:hypothetical protein
LNNFKTEPNATENCEKKINKKKLRSLILPEAQEEKKEKESQPKNKTQHVSPSLSKQLEKLYSKEATPCSAL